MKTQEERVAIAKQLISGVGYKIKKVHRHIKDGDAVVLNRYLLSRCNLIH